MFRVRDARPYLPELVWHFLAAFVPFSLALAVFLYGYAALERARAQEMISNSESSRIATTRNATHSSLEEAFSDIQHLSNDPVTRDWLDNPAPAQADRLIDELLLFARAKRIYDQIRLIDVAGKEVFRVNYASGQSRAVPKNELQDKSNRYYFTESVNIGRGEIYISPLDLNVEGNVVETPLKPMIRLATPLFDGQGNRKGVLVVNYLAQTLLGKMSEAAAGIDGDFMVLNNNGFWLLSPKHEDEWGFQLNHGKNFADGHAEAWRRIQAGDEQFHTSMGLYTVVALRPTGDVSSGQPNIVVSTGSVAPQSYVWWLVSYIPESRMRVLLDGEAKTRVTYAFVLLLIAVLSLSYSAMRVARLRSDENLKQAAKVMEVTRDGVLILDSERRILSANQSASAITGFLPGELSGMSDHALLAHQNEAEREEALWRQVEDHDQWQGEIWCRRKNGEVFTAHATISRIDDHKGRFQNYIKIFSDITDRKLEEQALLKLAYHDPLTELPNRALFLDRLEMAVAVARRSGRKLAVLFIDLDKFKPVNDALGHEAGDLLLIETAKRLQGALREADTVARFGGDEFVVLLAEIEHDHDALAVAGTLVERIKEPFAVKGRDCHIGCSIGASLFPQDGESPAQLVEKADQAMYQAKQAGSGAIRLHGRELPDHPVPARRYLKPVT